jgi:hypothetical protein
MHTTTIRRVEEHRCRRIGDALNARIFAHHATVELENALDHPLGSFDIFDPDDDLPQWVAREGLSFVREFNEVRALRHELE